MTAPPNQVLRGILVMVVATFLFASVDVFNKLLTESYAIAQIVWVRYMMFSAFALWLARADVAGYVRSGLPWFQVGRALLLIVEMAMFVLALRHLPVADMHAVAGAAPLVVLALSGPLLGERVNARQWGAVAIGFVGVLVVVRPGFGETGIGMVYALLAMLSWAFYQIMLRVAGRVDRAETTLLYSALVGLPVMCLVGPQAWQAPDAWGWFLFAMSGLIGSGAHLATTRALTLAPASVLQPYNYMMIVFAAIVGYAVFGQFPDAWTCAGAGIIVASGLYAWWSARSDAPARPKAAASSA